MKWFMGVLLGLSTVLHADPVTFIAIGRPSMLKIRGECSGKIVSPPPNFEATVELKECVTGIALRDKHMREKYLEVEIHPVATLKAQLPKEGDWKGKLTVHGKEAEVIGEIKDGVLRFSTTIEAHGITIPQFMGVTVANEVKIEAQILGVK